MRNSVQFNLHIGSKEESVAHFRMTHLFDRIPLRYKLMSFKTKEVRHA